MVTPDPIDAELALMAGNAKLAEAVKASLSHMASTGDGALAEMARELLAGRTSLREVANSEAYAAELSAGVNKFQSWYVELSPEQKADLERQGREELAGN